MQTISPLKKRIMNQNFSDEEEIHKVYDDTYLEALVDTETWRFKQNNQMFTFLNLFKARSAQYPSNTTDYISNKDIVELVKKIEYQAHYLRPSNQTKGKRCSVILDYQGFEAFDKIDYNDPTKYGPQKIENLKKLLKRNSQTNVQLIKSVSQLNQYQDLSPKKIRFNCNSNNNINKINVQKSPVKKSLPRSQSNCRILLRQIEDNIDRKYQRSQSPFNKSALIQRMQKPILKQQQQQEVEDTQQNEQNVKHKLIQKFQKKVLDTLSYINNEDNNNKQEKNTHFKQNYSINQKDSKTNRISDENSNIQNTLDGSTNLSITKTAMNTTMKRIQNSTNKVKLLEIVKNQQQQHQNRNSSPQNHFRIRNNGSKSPIKSNYLKQSTYDSSNRNESQNLSQQYKNDHHSSQPFLKLHQVKSDDSEKNQQQQMNIQQTQYGNDDESLDNYLVNNKKRNSNYFQTESFQTLIQQQQEKEKQQKKQIPQIFSKMKQQQQQQYYMPKREQKQNFTQKIFTTRKLGTSIINKKQTHLYSPQKVCRTEIYEDDNDLSDLNSNEFPSILKNNSNNNIKNTKANNYFFSQAENNMKAGGSMKKIKFSDFQGALQEISVKNK